MKTSLIILILAINLACLTSAQTTKSSSSLPAKLEELSSPLFVRALEKAQRTCVIPMGILEKHGPHLPVGTDLMQVREMCLRAVATEYAIVYPPYYFGQINEAKHQPGTIAYSQELIWRLLQETCDELSRNGVRKIVLVNGHGGNNDFLKYFCMSQLERKREYALYLVDPWVASVYEVIQPKLKSTMPGGHADETETSMIMALRPELVDLEAAKKESGEDQKRLAHLTNIFTGIAWYAGFPNHYSGQGFNATAELGELQLQLYAKVVSDALKQIKADTVTPALQEQFFHDSQNPARTGK